MKASEHGNVMFYILIAIALLAALTYAVARSGRGSMSEISEEKTKILASEIIDYASAVSTATAQLRLRGVKETDLCFDDTQWGGAAYTNASCTDTQTKIFDASTGGITWAKVAVDAADSAATPDYLWHIYADNEIEGVGLTCGAGSCAELVLITDELKQAVCIKINDLLDVTNPSGTPPEDIDFGTEEFDGSYTYTATIGDEAGSADLEGKTAGCFLKTTAPAEYVFYKVLQAR